MRKFKTAILKMGGLVASLALIVGVASAQTPCMSWYHQPKFPQAMEKFKKLV